VKWEVRLYFVYVEASRTNVFWIGEQSHEPKEQIMLFITLITNHRNFLKKMAAPDQLN